MILFIALSGVVMAQSCPSNCNISSSSTIFGLEAGISLDRASFGNTFLGRSAGRDNTLGNKNSFFGASAGIRTTTGSENCFFGQATGVSNTTGIANSYFGEEAGKNGINGNYNSFFGNQTGIGSSGSFNSFFGASAGGNNSKGEFNSFFGVRAGQFGSGSFNSFFGVEAGQNITFGSRNVFLGYQAGYNERNTDNKLYIANDSTSNPLIYGEFDNRLLRINGDLEVTGNIIGLKINPDEINLEGINLDSSNTLVGIGTNLSITTGSLNSFFGQSAGTANTTGSRNSFFGNLAGVSNITGNNNSFFGYQAGGRNVSGRQNTFIGAFTGFKNKKGIRNVMIGHKAGFNETGSNKLYIANNDTKNPLIYGEFNNKLLRINGNLSVIGNMSLLDLPEIQGRPLVIDTKGNVGISSNNYLSKITTLETEVEKLKRENSEIKNKAISLEERIAKLEALVPSNQTLKTNTKAKLYQNQPNPFKQVSKIHFFLPIDTRQATLHMYDKQGIQIKKIDLVQRGEASISLQTETLKAGIYYYTLIVDGQRIATKRMKIKD